MTRERQHGTRSCYVSGCRQPECCEANREYFRDYYRISRTYYGLTPDVDPTRTERHIQQLRGQGMGYREIARAAGVRKDTIRKIANGERARGVRPDTERKILAVRPDPYWVCSTGATRRLRALSAIGHSQESIANAAGITRRTVGAIMAGNQPTVYRPTDEAIRTAYDALSMTVGTSAEARRRAAEKSWASPLAWDDETIDDPTASPTGVGFTKTPLDLDDWLDLVNAGENGDRAARRLGVSISAIARSARRHGRLDIAQRAETARNQTRRAVA